MLAVKEGEYLESCKSNFSYLKPGTQDKICVCFWNIQFTVLFHVVYILHITVHCLSSLLTNSFTRQLHLLLQQRRMPWTQHVRTNAEVFHKVWRRGAVVF